MTAPEVLKYSQLPSPGLAGRGGRLPRSGKLWATRARLLADELGEAADDA